jgi:predicted nucleic acid-binding protein
MAVRLGVISSAEGTAKLHLARHLGIHTVATRALWHGALLRSVETNVAVYDTLFVELAEREGAPLVTFDQRLLKNWPAIACRPADAS